MENENTNKNQRMFIKFNWDDLTLINKIIQSINMYTWIVWWYKIDIENKTLKIDDLLSWNDFWVIINRINEEIKWTDITFQKSMIEKKED